MKKIIFFLLFVSSLYAQNEIFDPSYSISSLQAEGRNNLVRLGWNDSLHALGPVYIYRTQYPFNPNSFEAFSLGDLFSGVRPIMIPYGIGFYIDEIDYRGTYYYFAASSDETGAVYHEMLPGINLIGISITGDLPYPPDLQFIIVSPLLTDILPPENNFAEVNIIREPLTFPPARTSESDLHPDIVFLLEGIPARAPPNPADRNPMYFIQDLYAANGDELILSSIVTGSFWDMDWHKAKDELIEFLSMPRSFYITARARFYLGQCFYFLHMGGEGLFEFLLIQDAFPFESAEWVQACLVLLRN